MGPHPPRSVGPGTLKNSEPGRVHCRTCIRLHAKGDRAFAVATLKKLAKLSELKARGTILERLYEVIKKHANGGNSLTKHNWEAGHWVVLGTGVRSLAISFSNLLSF